jgi:hypothetical protein
VAVTVTVYVPTFVPASVGPLPLQPMSPNPLKLSPRASISAIAMRRRRGSINSTRQARAVPPRARWRPACSGALLIACGATVEISTFAVDVPPEVSVILDGDMRQVGKSVCVPMPFQATEQLSPTGPVRPPTDVTDKIPDPLPPGCPMYMPPSGLHRSDTRFARNEVFGWG